MIPFYKRTFTSFAACLCLLILAILAVYQQTFHYDFVFDDHQFIIANTAIRSWNKILYFFANGFPLNRLLTVCTFTLNYQLYGLKPYGFHVFNVLIHMAVACSVWWFFRLLLVHSFQGSEKEELRLHWLAFFGALLFALHPVQTQAVSYISQRFSSLSTLFYVLSVCFYLRTRQESRQHPKAVFIFFFIITFCMAILSKEESITLPVMIIVIELFFFQTKRLPSGFWLNAITGLIFFMIIFTWLFKSNIISLMTIQGSSESHDNDILTGPTYLLTQIRVLMTFLRLIVWPYPQTIDYDYPLSAAFFDPRVIFGSLIIAGLLMTIVRAKKKTPLLSFGILWILITFSANLFPRANLLWEQKVYLISIGSILAFIVILNHVIHSSRRLFIVVTTLTIILGISTFSRNHVWRNDLTLWTDALAKAPLKSRILLNAATAYTKNGDIVRGLELFQRAKTLYPSDAFVARNLGAFYFNQGNFKASATEYERALYLDPGNLESLRYFALSCERMNAFEQAIAIYSRNISPENQQPEIYAWRAEVYIKMNQYEKAHHDLVTALTLAPKNIDALIALIKLCQAQKRYPQVEGLLNAGIENNPDNEQLFLIRSLYYQSTGNKREALKAIRKAFALNPYNPEVASFYYFQTKL